MLLMMMPTDVPDVGPEIYPGADPGTPNLPPDWTPEDPGISTTDVPEIAPEFARLMATISPAPGEESLWEDDLTEERQPSPAQREDVAQTLRMDPSDSATDPAADDDDLGDDDDDDLEDDDDDTLDDA